MLEGFLMIPLTTLYDEYFDRSKLSEQKKPIDYLVPPTQEGSEQKSTILTKITCLGSVYDQWNFAYCPHSDLPCRLSYFHHLSNWFIVQFASRNFVFSFLGLAFPLATGRSFGVSFFYHSDFLVVQLASTPGWGAKRKWPVIRLKSNAHRVFPGSGNWFERTKVWTMVWSEVFSVWGGLIRGTFCLGWSDQRYFLSGVVWSEVLSVWGGLIRGHIGLRYSDQGSLSSAQTYDQSLLLSGDGVVRDLYSVVVPFGYNRCIIGFILELFIWFNIVQYRILIKLCK